MDSPVTNPILESPRYCMDLVILSPNLSTILQIRFPCLHNSKFKQVKEVCHIKMRGQLFIIKSTKVFSQLLRSIFRRLKLRTTTKWSHSLTFTSHSILQFCRSSFNSSRLRKINNNNILSKFSRITHLYSLRPRASTSVRLFHCQNSLEIIEDLSSTICKARTMQQWLKKTLILTSIKTTITRMASQKSSLKKKSHRIQTNLLKVRRWRYMFMLMIQIITLIRSINISTTCKNTLQAKMSQTIQ